MSKQKKDVKHEVCSRVASFLRKLDEASVTPHVVDGKCVYCGALIDELHEPDCPMYDLEGIRQSMNYLFFRITTKEERAAHKKAF